jgi:hypothetical protein
MHDHLALLGSMVMVGDVAVWSDARTFPELNMQ